MADPNDKLVQQGGMMIPETLVRPQTPLLSQSQNAQSESKGPSGVAPLTKRMSMAFDRNIKNDKPKEDRTNIVALGRLFLELEQVNNNLEIINREVAASSKRLDKLQAEELELLEKEGDRFTAIGASFQKLRRQFGGIAALLAGKQFLEGDIKGGFQNSIFAISAFLPEIIKVTSGIVLGRMLIGGRGGVASRGVASVGRGRGLMGLLLAGGGLFGANAILGSQGGGDQRRFELTRRQALPQLLSRNDVRRFRSTTQNFDNILEERVNSDKFLSRGTTTRSFVGTAANFEDPANVEDITKDLSNTVTTSIKDFLGFGEGDNEEDKVSSTMDNEEEINSTVAMSDISSEFSGTNLAFDTQFDDEDVSSVLDDILGTGIDTGDDGGQTEGPSVMTKMGPGSEEIFVNPEYSHKSKIAFYSIYGVFKG